MKVQLEFEIIGDQLLFSKQALKLAKLNTIIQYIPSIYLSLNVGEIIELLGSMRKF